MESRNEGGYGYARRKVLFGVGNDQEQRVVQWDCGKRGASYSGEIAASEIAQTRIHLAALLTLVITGAAPDYVCYFGLYRGESEPRGHTHARYLDPLFHISLRNSR